MVTTFMHLVWSTTLGQVMNIKNLVRFLFLGIVLDFDIIPNLFWPRPIDHRDYFHTVFFISVILLAIWLYKRSDKNDELLKSASAAFSLHILLDLFDGNGVPLVFPLSAERLLVYSIGEAYAFPLKLYWEGNIYFAAVSVALLLAVVISSPLKIVLITLIKRIFIKLAHSLKTKAKNCCRKI